VPPSRPDCDTYSYSYSYDPNGPPLPPIAPGCNLFYDAPPSPPPASSGRRLSEEDKLKMYENISVNDTIVLSKDDDCSTAFTKCDDVYCNGGVLDMNLKTNIRLPYDTINYSLCHGKENSTDWVKLPVKIVIL